MSPVTAAVACAACGCCGIRAGRQIFTSIEKSTCNILALFICTGSVVGFKLLKWRRRQLAAAA